MDTLRKLDMTANAGFQDAGAYSAAMQSAVLRFRGSGVDRVFVMGSQENLLLQYFAEQAQSQAYHPGYALSSGSLPVTLINALCSVIPTLGSAFASTGITNGSTLFSTSRQNGPVLANEWGFNSSCTCFRYVGQPAPMR